MPGAGFAGGFVGGLSSAMDEARQRRLDAEARRTQHAREAISTILPNVKDLSDIEPLLQVAYPDVYGEQAKKAKKGGVGAHDIVNQFLGHAMQADQGQANMVHPDQAFGGNQGAGQVLPPMPGAATQTPAPAAADTSGQGGPPSDQDQNALFGLPSDQQQALPSSPVSLPGQMAAKAPAPGAPAGAAPSATPAAKPSPTEQRTLFGIPVLSTEEVNARDIARKTGMTEADLNAKIGLARRMLPAMKALDPSVTMRDVMSEIFGHRLGGYGSAAPYTAIYGTADGKSVSAVFDKARGAYVDSMTHEPIPNFIPTRGNASAPRLTGAAGQAVQQALLEMGEDPTSVDHTSPEYAHAVKVASARLANERNLSAAGKQAALDLKNWSLGNPQGPATPAASSPAAAGAGAAPGAEPSAQPSPTPGAAPTAAPAPSVHPAVASGIVTIDDSGKPTYNYDAVQPGADKQYKGKIYDTLDPVMQAEARRFAFYQQAPPGTRAAVTPRVAKELAAAQEINPSFSQVNYPNIQQGLKAFTTGKQGDNLASLNMTLGHLNEFAKTAEALNNADLVIWNRLANKTIQETGDPRVDRMLTAREALSNELTRLFRGTGGNEEEVKNWRARLDASKSPEQFGAVVRELNSLITSRQKSLKNQWETIKGAPSWDEMGFVAKDLKDTIAQTDAIARRMGGLKPAANGAAKPGTTPQNKPGKSTDVVPNVIVKPDGTVWQGNTQIGK